MLGADLVKAFSGAHDVFPMPKNDLDITDINAVMNAVSSVKPDLVINSAAFTKVDECEEKPDLAYKVNGYGAGNVAIACEEAGARLVHISTDYVFDGKKGTPYLEDDGVNPLNVYGKSKLLGERNVISFCRRHYIVRTQGLFGANGKNFAETILRNARAGKPLTVVNDQFGSPTYTRDLAAAILTLTEKPEYGIYHITNSGVASWYEFALEILKAAGIEGADIAPCMTAEYPRPAERPAYSVLGNYRWGLAGFGELAGYREALERYLRESVNA